MNKSAPSIQTDEFLDLITLFMRYRRRVMATLPDELLQRKKRLEKLHLADGLKAVTERDLFFRVGITLSRSDTPLPMGELGKAIDVPLSTATRIMDGLVEHGYAERMADPDDRRIVRVALTADGAELFQTLYDHLRRRIDEMFNRLTAEERTQLLALLRKAMGALDELGE